MVMLKLENIIVRLHLLASFLGGQSGLASLLFADKGGATGRLGDANSSHSSFLLVQTEVG